MEHQEKPETVENVPEEVLKFCERMKHSPYWSHLRECTEQIKGKVVISSLGGSSGYILELEDDLFTVCFLKEGRMELMIKDKKPSEQEIEWINSEESGNASEPLMFDRPYADESCDISEAVKMCEGLPVTGIARGEDTFNLCFPDGMELDAMIVPDRAGRRSLRIFWEQW